MQNRPLNQEQSQAVFHDTGPMLVLAGPGSGKTLTVTRRVRFLIRERHAPPDSILVVTFTKAAAMEMRSRFLSLMGEGTTPVVFGTFHSVFYQILRHSYQGAPVTLVTEKRRLTIIQEILQTYSNQTDQKERAIHVAADLSRLKNQGGDLTAYHPGSMDPLVFKKVYEAYGERLSAAGEIDFDDMLLKCRELFLSRPQILKLWQKKYRYILIDEFQDSATRFRLR